MKPTIYLDVLLLINLFVTYFLLASTDRLLQKKTSQSRLVLASVLGSAYSLIILADGTPLFLLTMLKLLVSCLLVLVAFGWSTRKLFFKQLLIFYLVNFIFAGLMFALWYFVTPSGMIYQNGVIYFNISALVLCGTSILAYLLILLYSHFTSRSVSHQQLVTLKLVCNQQETLLNAFVDTGNKLTDLVTGLPVIVCELNSVKSLLPQDVQSAVQTLSFDQISEDFWKRRLRVLPVLAVTGQTLMPVFKPDALFLLDKFNETPKDAIIALSIAPLSNGEFSALIGSSLL